MVKRDRRTVIVVCLALAVLPAGCDKDTSNPPGGQVTTSPAAATTAAAAPFAGTWTGTWKRTSPPPGDGTYTFVLQQQGQSISGTLTTTGSACLTHGNVTGSVTVDHITMHTKTPAINGNGDATGEYQGTLSGNKITGTLTVTCSVGVGLGTWEVTKQ